MTPKQVKALAALIAEPTQEQAAKAAGISAKTLRKYLTIPEFKSAYQRACGDLLHDATRQAQKTLAPAVCVLREIMENPNEGAQARIQAARSLLDFTLRYTEQTDILTKLRELEQWRDNNDAREKY